MLKALVHAVPPNLNRCELSFRKRVPIDYDLAVAQHRRFCEVLQAAGVELIELTANMGCPDAAFVEDVAVVFEEVAVICSMGVASRRGETAAVEAELAKYRPVARVSLPATIEGGDVLQLGSQVFVGLSDRTNKAGVKALRHLLSRFGYEVIPVQVTSCLHLKTACTPISRRSLLANPAWVDLGPFSEYNVVTVPEEEPWAANALLLGDLVVVHSGFPRTEKLLRDLEFEVVSLDLSEFIKAEAGPSCLAMVFNL